MCNRLINNKTDLSECVFTPSAFIFWDICLSKNFKVRNKKKTLKHNCFVRMSPPLKNWSMHRNLKNPLESIREKRTEWWSVYEYVQFIKPHHTFAIIANVSWRYFRLLNATDLLLNFKQIPKPCHITSPRPKAKLLK